MSEFEQDPSASTARFQAFVERHDQDAVRARRSSLPPAALIAGIVVIIAVIVIVVAVA